MPRVFGKSAKSFAQKSKEKATRVLRKGAVTLSNKVLHALNTLSHRRLRREVTLIPKIVKFASNATFGRAHDVVDALVGEVFFTEARALICYSLNMARSMVVRPQRP